MKKFIASILVGTLFSISLSACTQEESSNRMFADVILLDISGSGLNSADTYNSENHTVTSLSSRAGQLRTKLARALSDNHAVYFGFVRKTYGQQQIETLISPKLILTINSILDSDVKDPKLREDARSGILQAWQTVVSDNPQLAESSECRNTIETKISLESNGSISDLHAGQLAASICSNASSANEQIKGLTRTPENIGSEIQGAIDRSIEKLVSDERRLVNKDGKPMYLVPTIVLVSDLMQVTSGVSIKETLGKVKDTSAACDLAQEETANYESVMSGIALISDGFASTKKDINTELREKLREYWKCWLESRGITDLDLGARGIDLGEI